MALKIDERMVGDVVIMSVKGEIDLYNAPDVKDMISDYIEDDKVKLVMNLEQLSFIDSSGIGALISSLSNLQKENGALKLVNMHGSVRKVFDLTKLTGFFGVYDSEEEAVNSFNQNREN
jgi:anti-sigma B factor antagonist